MTMFRAKSRQTLGMSIGLFLLVFMVGCENATNLTSSTPTAGLASSIGTPTTPGADAAKATPTVVTSAACPQAGSGRAPMMPMLQLGKRQEIVYYHNIDSQMILDIFDVQRQAVVAITGQNNEHIQTAQLSADGQWVLMVVDVQGISEMQLVRIDGNYFQTFYCAPAGQQIDPSNSTGTQWSPDQKQIVFVQGANAHVPQLLYLLNVASGSVQLELTPGANANLNPSTDFLPVTWIDNERVYVVNEEPNFSSLSILDTRKGPNQHAVDLQEIVGPHQVVTRDFDSSYDASKLFIGEVYGSGSSHGISITCGIDVMPTNEANFAHPMSCGKLVVTGLRVIGHNASSLLLNVKGSANFNESSQNDGFWKMNTDGIEMTQLNHEPGNFNKFTQFPWSNFSRDGSLYTDGLFYGALNGGPLMRYASDGEGDGNVLVGWTEK